MAQWPRAVRTVTDWLTLSKLENVHATAVSELYLHVFNLYRDLSDNLSVCISTYQYVSEFMLNT